MKRMNRKRTGVPAFLLALVLIGVTVGCSKGQVKEGGDAAIKLRRIDVAAAGFDALSLEVVVAVDNTGDSEIVVTGGQATLEISGPATEAAKMAPSEGITQVGADGSDDDSETAGESDDAEDEADEAEDDDASDDEADGDEGEVALPSQTTFKGQGGDGTACPPGEVTEVRIPVQMPLPNNPEELEALLNWSRVLMDVEGTVSFGGRTESFSRPREVGLPAVPEVRLKLAQVGSEDQGAAGAAFMSVAIYNPNPFPVLVDRFQWEVKVGEKTMRAPTEGGESEKVPATAEAVYEDNFQLNTETYGEDVKKLLNQPTIPYRIEGFMEIRGIKKPFSFDGEMAFAR
jgi:LEA14-like dessication related protein